MASLDTKSLFINIPLKETKTCFESLYKNQEFLFNINKNQFEKILRTALCKNKFLFDGIVYQQVDGVAVHFFLGPSLANSNLAHYEQIWLDDFPDEFKLAHYKRYGNDIFVIFRSLPHLEKFNEYLHTKFTNKNEVNGSLPLLDVLISQNNNSFTTTVYHKPKFSGFYSNFNSFIADEHKNGIKRYVKKSLSLLI